MPQVIGSMKGFDSYISCPTKWMEPTVCLKHGVRMPSFTAKHYTAIAAVIHQARKELKAPIGIGPQGKPWDSSMIAAHEAEMKIRLEQTNAMTLAYCKLFSEDNPKFKEFQFIAACNRDLEES